MGRERRAWASRYVWRSLDPCGRNLWEESEKTRIVFVDSFQKMSKSREEMVRFIFFIKTEKIAFSLIS